VIFDLRPGPVVEKDRRRLYRGFPLERPSRNLIGLWCSAAVQAPRLPGTGLSMMEFWLEPDGIRIPPVTLSITHNLSPNDSAQLDVREAR